VATSGEEKRGKASWHGTKEQRPMERGATCGGSRDGKGWEGGAMGKEAMPIKRAVNSSGQDRATAARVSGDGAKWGRNRLGSREGKEVSGMEGGGRRSDMLANRLWVAH
jgi:hypothetical protein